MGGRGGVPTFYTGKYPVKGVWVICGAWDKIGASGHEAFYKPPCEKSGFLVRERGEKNSFFSPATRKTPR